MEISVKEFENCSLFPSGRNLKSGLTVTFANEMSKKIAKPFTYHLAKAQIKGYKSIRDLTVEFNKGLTILIGKNGTGKSNFLEGVELSMRFNIRNTKDIFNFTSTELQTSDNDIFTWENKPFFQLPSKNKLQQNIEMFICHEKLYLNGVLLKDDSKISHKFKSIIEYKNRKALQSNSVIVTLHEFGFEVITPLLIAYNLPNHIDTVDSSGNLKIETKLHDHSLKQVKGTFTFLRELLNDIEFEVNLINAIKLVNAKDILKRLIFKNEILESLKKYTPIKGLRFNQNINVYKKGTEITIENLKLEFLVNNEWMPWSYLSDGTKRLFYLVAEVSNRDSGIVLIEEPELGVHPHQFFELMNFLKEQSTNKQIIVSTHSPQACDVFSRDELINIRIATYDPKKGTQIKPMNKTQITKAHKYMDTVGSFSDFWMHSPDFEV